MRTKQSTPKAEFEYGYVLGKETFEEEYSEQTLTEDDVREFVTRNLAPYSAKSKFLFQVTGTDLPPQDYDIGFVVGWLSSLLVAGLSEGKHIPYLLPLLDSVQYENDAVFV